MEDARFQFLIGSLKTDEGFAAYFGGEQVSIPYR